MEPRERLIVALDLSSRDDILRMADRLHGLAGCFKIGLQAFISNGPDLVRELTGRGEKVFVDLKIHDIPNTAKHAIQAVDDLGCAMATVHTSGGQAMLAACAGTRCLVLGVTVLTSMDDEALRETGCSDAPAGQVVRLARLAQRAGLRGVVASPHEIQLLREVCGDDLVIVTPGIRSASDPAGDQKRTLTAGDAMARGADYLVIGRPITAAMDPASAAARFIDEMGNTRLS